MGTENVNPGKVSTTPGFEGKSRTVMNSAMIAFLEGNLG
jgi:hypothetical protein